MASCCHHHHLPRPSSIQGVIKVTTCCVSTPSSLALLPLLFHRLFLLSVDGKKKAPTKKQIAEEAVAAAVVLMGDGEADEAMMASLDPKKRKTNRIRIDPLMPRGGVAPNEWAEMEDLEEGCRGILVSF